MRKLSLLGAVLAVLAVTGAGTAPAEPPFRLADRVTDRAGVLDPTATAQVREATARLAERRGYDLFVVFVDSFDGLDGQEWADDAAERSQLGVEDVLFAVAVDDRAYGLSVADDFPESETRVDDVRSQDVEPRLREDDWAGAAVALAEGLGTGGGVPVGVLAIGGAALVGGGAYLVARRRRAAREKPTTAPVAPGPAPDAPPDEFPGVSTADLAYRASAALIAIDEAVRTSEQELAAAKGHFGEEAVAGFTAALEQSRADMLAAFEVRQRLDDDEPEDEPTQRAMYGEILRACTRADERLDAQVEAFDQLRDLEAKAPEYVAGLAERLAAVTADLPRAEAAWTALRARYADAATAPVAGNLDRARALLIAAETEVAQARAELTGAGPTVAVVSGRAAEDAITQARTLLDGIPRRDAELTEATAQVPAAAAELDQDLAEARAMGPDLAPAAARAEAAAATARSAVDGDRPDPITALRLLDEAGAALDQALAEAKADRDRDRHAAAALEQARLTARSAVSAAEDFIATRRGAVGSRARTRLSEAQRHLALAGGGDPVAALAEAQRADSLAQEALRLARDDVAGWREPGPTVGGGLAADLGSLVLGGILSGAVRGAGRPGRSGGSRGGFSPGSFGGSGTRGRRGGGGRF
ncbi:TPM domain-containing protein [Pseudonocardia humida]|uniref:TPM domain-containing protein n=1 Tax=Pseudonocardia humida TaxID=2800819 RepID=A0ABT0ZWY5_9PSEU|nr:TPM domain-containing protein [Pseudonocardia humida]MCO1655257.1 TPM domain-containing protein [Pseudonocardia humida]